MKLSLRPREAARVAEEDRARPVAWLEGPRCQEPLAVNKERISECLADLHRELAPLAYLPKFDHILLFALINLASSGLLPSHNLSLCLSCGSACQLCTSTTRCARG